MRSSPGPELTIGTVSEQTGVPVTVLRSWEQRYGFPAALRSAGGHRRYHPHDVEQIDAVQQARTSGLSLRAAIERVVSDRRQRAPSIAAGLREAWPHLTTQVLTKPSMVMFSRAIEDECCLRADRPVLLGAFQHERYYRQSKSRWRSLARTASAAVVLAHFPQRSEAADQRGTPTEVPVEAAAPVLNEWAIICDARDRAACLIGWELPGQADVAQHARRFEAMWSVEPPVVRDAALIVIDIATSVDERHAELRSHLGVVPPTDTHTVRFAQALTVRIIAYLETPTVS